MPYLAPKILVTSKRRLRRDMLGDNRGLSSTSLGPAETDFYNVGATHSYGYESSPSAEGGPSGNN